MCNDMKYKYSKLIAFPKHITQRNLPLISMPAVPVAKEPMVTVVEFSWQ